MRRTSFVHGLLCVLVAGAAVAAPATGVGGWQEAVISVDDLDNWRDMFVRVAGWEVLHEGEMLKPWLQAWELPDKVSAREIVLANRGTQAGWVRLVKFRGVAQRQNVGRHGLSCPCGEGLGCRLT